MLRVLLLNAGKRDHFPVQRLHLGLSLLSAKLRAAGHAVRVIDYAFLRSVRRLTPPTVAESITDFRPDVVGISVFTYLYAECQGLIEQVAQASAAPIVLGGPHLRLFPEDFANDRRIACVVRGEAERVIVDVVERVRAGGPPEIIEATIPSVEEIPPADLEAAWGVEDLAEYQIQLSRGCPFQCTFCNIHEIAGVKVRARSLPECLAEIIAARERFPRIRSVNLTDDCPTFDRERFKCFLRQYRDAHVGASLKVDNLRADGVDEELVRLYKAAGGVNICLGVESGDPEVLRLCRKNETLGEIEHAAHLVRQEGLALGLCFVIGLPGDTPERHRHSVELVRRLRPNYVYWNMCVPWPGTEIRKWYDAHGHVADPRGFSTLVSPAVQFGVPVCDSPFFPRDELIKAWLGANLETHAYFSRARDLPRLAALSLSYGILGPFLRFLLFRFPLAFLRGVVPPEVKDRLLRTRPRLVLKLRSFLRV